MEATRTFGALFLEAVALAVVLPPVAVRPLRRGLVVLGGILLLGLVAGLSTAAGAVPLPTLAAAQGLMLAYGVFLLGLARLLASDRSRGRGALASLVGLALLASPVLGDPFLEDHDGRVRPAVRETTLHVNPLAGAASPVLLGVDWLRRPLMYRAVTLGQFHAYAYPDPRVQGLLFFLAGTLLLLLRRGQIV